MLCGQPKRHGCIAASAKRPADRHYWFNSVSGCLRPTPLLPSSTLPDPSPFVHSLPVLIQLIVRHASHRCSLIRRASSQTQQWRGAPSTCCCFAPPLFQHVPPNKQAGLGNAICSAASIHAGDIRSTPTKCPIHPISRRRVHFIHSLHRTFVAPMSDRNHFFMAHPQISETVVTPQHSSTTPLSEQVSSMRE
ncbi:hypothetical protein CH063_06579 [Colletotrichum higginsianum]|uniref:Uncharacterized protein n=1 Tax=Colletotrichum higginsianum (strain IMI 349063) TaxID=759273 RepID=H1V323_COLHI|nr:hypothetical protein CH063_06579 [Colletotrichum higginsianum]